MDNVASKLKELVAKKDLIENDIKSYNEVLESQQNVGMLGPLLDEDQFPRSDIDIFTVRHARNRILCLNNDHKKLMQEIEECLCKLHQSSSKENLCNKKDAHAASIACGEPFASIGKVDSSSPSDVGGLKAGDEIIEFGSLNKSNFSSLENISRITRFNKGHPMDLLIRRGDQILRLSLTPNTWSGPGILGCTILPIWKQN